MLSCFLSCLRSFLQDSVFKGPVTHLPAWTVGILEKAIYLEICPELQVEPSEKLPRCRGPSMGLTADSKVVFLTS